MKGNLYEWLHFSCYNDNTKWSLSYNACTILAECSWCFWRAFSYLHVFHIGVFYLEIRGRRGLQYLTSHLLSYGYLAWVNSLSSFVTCLNILVKRGRHKLGEVYCETLPNNYHIAYWATRLYVFWLEQNLRDYDHIHILLQKLSRSLI